MEDITEIMNDFRECARHIWNTYGLKRLQENDWDFRDRLNAIEVELFRALVLYKFEREDTPLEPAQRYPQAVLMFLKLQPSNESSILINRGTAINSGLWDDPVNHFWKDEFDLRFIHYFDWEPLGYRDFAYY